MVELPADPQYAGLRAAERQRPRTVTLALLLNGIIIALIVDNGLHRIAHFIAAAPTDDSALAFYFMALCGYAVLLTVCLVALVLLAIMWSCHDWARYLYAGFILLGVPLLGMQFRMTKTLFIPAELMLVAATILLFLPPAHRWFRKRVA